MKTIMENEKVPKENKFLLPGVRYLFVAGGFFGFFTIYAIRVNLNVAIVAMVNASVYNSNNNFSENECKVTDVPSSNATKHDHSKDGEFLWAPDVQATVIGSFYYGYCISQIPGGRLAELYSGKWVFGIGTFITALLTLITPVAARYHVNALIAIRALEGLAQGVTMPAMHSLIGRWLPDSEKAFLSTIIYCGIRIGTLVTLFVSGFLCDSDFLEGWPSAFYIIGVFGCVWFLFWCLFATDSPQVHPFISKKELEYITSNQKINSKAKLMGYPRVMSAWVNLLLISFAHSISEWNLLTVHSCVSRV